MPMRRRRSGRRTGGRSPNAAPHERDLAITVRKQLFYAAQGNSAPAVLTITGRDLMQLICSCNVASATVSVADWKAQVAAFKLHRVTVWPVEGATSSADNFVTIAWPHTSTAGGLGQPVRRLVRPFLPSYNGSGGPLLPAPVTSTPPAGSYQSLWLDSSALAEGMFQIQTASAGIGYVVELDISLSLCVGASIISATFGTTVTSSTPVAGQLMYAPLNSSTATGLTSAVTCLGFSDDYVNQFFIDT